MSPSFLAPSLGVTLWRWAAYRALWTVQDWGMKHRPTHTPMQNQKMKPLQNTCGIELLRLLRLWGGLLHQIVNIVWTNTDHSRKRVGTKSWTKYFLIGTLMQLPKTFELFQAACPQSLPPSTLQGWPFLHFQPVCATPASKCSQTTVTSNPRHDAFGWVYPSLYCKKSRRDDLIQIYKILLSECLEYLK